MIQSGFGIVIKKSLIRKEHKMSRKCDICGKGPASGNTIATRGKSKRTGGVGIKQTGVTKRRFKPNIQKVWAEVDGAKKKIKVCTKCIKSGEVVKPSL